MIDILHHIAIICSDREKALRFYCNALGFSVVSEHKRKEKKDIIINLTKGGVNLELFIVKNCPQRQSYPEAYGLRHLALKVTKLEAIIDKLTDLGYEPEAVRLDSFTGEKMTFVSDPDGLPIELHE